MVKVTEVTETSETAKMTESSPSKDGWTVASEAVTITGILGCCILAAGIILSPLILLEANSVWTSIDQEMDEFRDLEAVIWPEMMSLADVESKRFRRQFTALFPDVARVDDSEEVQDRAQPAGDYSESDYADGGVYYDDDESAAQDAEDYWEEDSPVHRDLVPDPNTYRWRKGPGAQPPSSRASRPSPQGSRKASRPSPSRDAWRKGQGVQAPVRRPGEPPALPLESRPGGVLPTDAELAARGHYPPGHPARSAAKAAAKDARQAVLREHEIQFKSDGSIVSKEVDPTAAQVVGGAFNRRPPGIVPLLPQPNVGVLTSIPLGNAPPDGTVQIGLGSYPAGTRRGQPSGPSAPSRRRPYVPGARPPAISLAQPRVRSIPVLAPQPAPPPLAAVLPPTVISSPILPVVAPPPAIAPRAPLVSVQGGLPTFPTRGGQRVPLTPQRRAQLEGNRRLPPELLYLNQFRRRGQFGGPASPINVLAPGFATSGGPSGPSPGLPYPPPQARSPQPPRTLDVFPGSPGSLKLQGQPPRPRPSAPSPAQPPRNPLPPSVQSINPRPPGPDIESFEFPLKAAEEPHEIDLGDPDDYDYEDVEDVDEAPARLPGSPGSIVSESSKAAPKRTRPDSRIQLPKNTLPDSLKARLSERLGPNAQALPPPPSRTSSRPITEERCPAGERGDRGPTGADGENGENGEPGRPGRAANNYQPTGESPFGGECMRCPQGAPGRKGRQGALGKLGVPGWAGQRGEPGQNGDFGKNGAKGSPGPQGVSGRKGAAGEDAPPVYSVKGPPGRRGRLGPRGDSGDPGLDGPRGFPGGRGGEGAGGFQGRRGLPGPEGRGGRRGPKGPQEYCSCPARKPLILGIIRDQIPNGRFG